MFQNMVQDIPGKIQHCLWKKKKEKEETEEEKERDGGMKKVYLNQSSSFF